MKYRKTKAQILHCLCSLLLAQTFICTGCQDQELAQSEEGTDVIAFALYNNETDPMFSPLTRTTEKPLILTNEDGTDSLTIYLTITDTIDFGESPYHTDTVISRGTPIAQNNLASLCSGQIALDAFYQNTPFIKDVIKFNANGEAHTGTTRYWPNNQGAKVAFWSYYPKEIAQATDFAISHTTPSLSFYYSQYGTDGKLIDVTNQKDLFLDYVYQGKEDGVVSLHYNHAVSAVKFAVGKTLAGIVQNITITDVYASGTLTYTPDATPEFSWKLDNKPSTLDQDFNVEIDENLSGNPSQPVTSDGDATTFLLIPQTVTGKELSITLNRPDKNKSDTYSAPLPDGVWEMGKTYTYTLNLMDGLSIDASGEVTDGVVIENTNNKACYVRAMIIGNWVDKDGNIADIFNPADVDLKITLTNNNYKCATDWGTYWYYDETNNLYYYKKPLPRGETTEVKLFDKFTNPKSRTDEDLKLDFVVLVQAVEADTDKSSAKAAWGDGSYINQLEPLNN